MIKAVLLIVLACSGLPEIGATRTSKQTNAIPKENAFAFSVQCDSNMSADSCSFAKQTLEMVGIMIAESLVISVPINVQVNFKTLNDICGSNLNDGKTICVPTISNSTGSYLVAQKDNGPSFRYPQAAIKQVMEVNSSTTQDIILEFNSNIKWNFGYSLTQRKISRNMYDLTLKFS